MKIDFLSPGSSSYYGLMDEMVQFSMQHQLLKEKNWKDFVEVFRSNSDDDDYGWRCEYWGKMMRGAVLTYMYNKDPQLYQILEQSVKDLLTVQQDDGRISTYSLEKEFSGGWDVWGRKYILTGCLHFYRICQSEALKKDILSAMMRHADAILSKVGPGKISIFATSFHWKGVNSTSILEPFLDLYQQTKEKRYLEFAEYLIRTGGCEDGNLIELAIENKLAPFEYPTVKAYETMSFFEGVLAYYEVTGQEKYLNAVFNFINAVDETDLTIIGCCGCTHELFDHSSVKQILSSESIMQETCVTVTWMRINARLFAITGDIRCMDRIEQSAYNALYGSVNLKQLPMLSLEDNQWVDPLPFDSYSPLFDQRRGRGIGGFKRFSFGGYYGCCACIASAGTALVPLCAIMKREKQGKTTIFCNLPVNGTAEIMMKDQQVVRLTESTDFPSAYTTRVRLQMSQEKSFEMAIRVPDYVEDDLVYVNGEQMELLPKDGYYYVSRQWKDGDEISLEGVMQLREIISATTVEEDGVEREISRAAFTFGPLALAADEEKEEDVDLDAPVLLSDATEFTLQEPGKGELIRGILAVSDENQDSEVNSETSLILTDYQSCGKNWRSNKGKITVWFNYR